MDYKIESDQLLDCAQKIIQFYNVNNKIELAESCNKMNMYLKKYPVSFTRTEHTYAIATALFYAIRERLCPSEDAIIFTYYLLVKTIRNSVSKHDRIGAAMLAFIFLDEHKELIGLNVIGNNLSSNIGANRNEIIIHQIIGQLCMFYWIFSEENNEKIAFDNLTMELLQKNITKFSSKVNGMDTNSIKKLIDFNMENFDVLLKTLQMFWEDIQFDDIY